MHLFSNVCDSHCMPKNNNRRAKDTRSLVEMMNDYQIKILLYAIIKLFNHHSEI